MDVKSDDRPEALEPCPLCGRLMLKGDSVDRHHWQPQSRGGKESEYLHRTCHRKVHFLFTDKELAADFASLDQVRSTPRYKNSSAGAPAVAGASDAPP